MTVAQLKFRIAGYEDTDQLPLAAIIPDLPYLVAALEEWRDAQERHGRGFHPEIDRFIEDASNCL